jgi:hypothetical protein
MERVSERIWFLLSFVVRFQLDIADAAIVTGCAISAPRWRDPDSNRGDHDRDELWLLEIRG